MPPLICLAGAGLLFFAAVSYAGHSMPYQDSTPQLLSVQQKQLQTDKLVAIAGSLSLSVGIALLFYRRKPHPRNRDL